MTRNAFRTARLGLNRLDDRCLPSAVVAKPSIELFKPNPHASWTASDKKEIGRIELRAAPTGEPLANCTEIGPQADDLHTAEPLTDEMMANGSGRPALEDPQAADAPTDEMMALISARPAAVTSAILADVA